MNNTLTIRNQYFKVTILSLLLMLFLLVISSSPVSAAARIKKTEYEGKGKVEIDFRSDVKYKNLKITVKNQKGKVEKIRILDKDDDDLEFKIVNYKAGQTYTYKITGICKKGEHKSGTLTGKIQIPKAQGNVPIKKIEYDADDQEVEFEFAADVKWKSPKVTITYGKKNYVRYIDDKDNDEIEVKVKRLKKGVTYQYTISGIKKRNGKSYGTITGSFRP